VNAAWPAEDGGPRRRQAVRGRAPSGPLDVVARDAAGAHMVIVGEPGQVFAYGSAFGDGSTAWIERLDPVTLAPLARAERLAPPGPWWPGGMALAVDGAAAGSLHLVHGRWAHRLTTDFRVLASRELPCARPYNSFVTLPDGALVTKDLVLDGAAASTLVALHPETLAPIGEPVPMPEGSIARLSADGDVVYAIGDHTAFRYRWTGRQLVRDLGWSFRYRTRAEQSYGWDPVVAGGHVWFMDNGAHRYAGTMVGKGVASGPVHLVRVAIDDAGDHELVEISGLPSGAVTNPPLYDDGRRIAVAYDSANGVLAAFDFDGRLSPRWRLPLNTAGHLLWYPDDGAVVAYHHDEAGEAVVVVDLEHGIERGRGQTGSRMQSVVFPAAADGVVYYSSFSTLARIA